MTKLKISQLIMLLEIYNEQDLDIIYDFDENKNDFTSPESKSQERI